MTNDLTKPAENAVSLFGSYKAEDDYADMRQQDLILPRLRLIQSQSPEAKPAKPGEKPKNQIGDYINSATGDILIPAGKASPIVVIGYWVEWIEWNPLKTAKNKILRKSADPESADGKEMSMLFERRVKVRGDDGKEKLRITEVFHFLVALPEATGNYEELFLLSLSRTSHKKGRELLNKCRGYKYPGNTEPRSPIFSAHWPLTADIEVNERKEEYMVPAFCGSASPVDPGWLPRLGEIATQARERRKAMQNVNSAATDDAHTERTDGAPVNDDFT